MTADRWAAMLRELGHDVRVAGEFPLPAGAEERPDDRDALPDLLVALHARKSLGSVRRFDERRGASERASPARLVLALTGTDLYRDLSDDGAEAWESVERADRLVALQDRAPEVLPRNARAKTRVIYQSVPELWDAAGREAADRNVADGDVGGGQAAEADGPPGAGSDDASLRVCMLAHLRPVKNPLLAARAAERLPGESGVRIDHYGSAYGDDLARAAREASARDSGYRWHGEIPRAEALRRLADSDLLLVTSRLEGAGNAVSEAITARVPILCTRIAGLEGMVGSDYPGFFAPDDAGELARLLVRAEEEPSFLRRLRAGVEERRPLLDPARERSAWDELLRELGTVES